MTTETDCPSHIEARERLAENDVTALADLIVTHSIGLSEAKVGRLHRCYDALRTLLATPTQDPADQFPHQAFLRACGPRVGREEIARIIDPRTFERWDVLCDQAGEIEADRQYGAACARAFVKADTILSLLPVPKPGEGAENADAAKRLRMWEAFDDTMLFAAISDAISTGVDGGFQINTDAFRASLKDTASALSPQQPAPGAPEGWQKLSPNEQFALATRIAANVGYELKPEPPLSALTSSSAKPTMPPVLVQPIDTSGGKTSDASGLYRETSDGSGIYRQTADAGGVYRGPSSSSAKLGGEAFPGEKAVTDYADAIVGPLEATYRDQIRRLREGLEEAADALDWVPSKKLRPIEAIYLNKRREAARAALKDNGHG